MKDTIKRVALIYLIPEGGEYYITDDLGYSIQRRPQLGLQYLCAILHTRGIVANILDQSVSFLDFESLLRILRDYDLAGFYCSDVQEEKVKKYCIKIKQVLQIPILVGGPSTLSNSSFLDFGCDIVVHGEGEITIQQIIDHYNGALAIEDILGISYKKNGKVIKSGRQKLIENLDGLPLPDRSKVDILSYHDFFIFSMRKPYITMIASRGCVYRCYFCTSHTIWGNKYRARSVDNVISEIDDAVRKYKVKYIAFQDDVFGISDDWVEDFCEKLIKRNYKIRWMVILHPCSFAKDQKRILTLMKRAGCDTLSFGLQSAHPDILKNINRDPTEPQRLKIILHTAQRLGFLTVVGFIFGLPEDTKKTIRTTIDYAVTCGATLVNYYMLSVLSGSEIERLYKNRDICELPRDEIARLVVYAARKFYCHPKNLLTIAYCIIQRPRWLIYASLRLPSLLSRIGFVRIKLR